MENEPTNEPLDVNYIITHEGIVQVPHTLIERDKGYPIIISAQTWRENQKKPHSRLRFAFYGQQNRRCKVHRLPNASQSV